MFNIIRAATVLATLAHKGQSRKHSFFPFIVHPLAVRDKVSEVGGTDKMIAAAVLHDVVEDTWLHALDIENFFGEEVAQLVEELTAPSTKEDGNRATRKAIDLEHLSHASPEAQTVKLADMLDNMKDIVKQDPAFARVWLLEQEKRMDVLHAGHAGLREEVSTLLRDSLAQLGM